MVLCGEFASVEVKSANKVDVENSVLEMKEQKCLVQSVLLIQATYLSLNTI